MTDMVNRPSHYVEGRQYEPLNVIADWDLNYRLGSALKYISRAGRKDPSKTAEDLKKAVLSVLAHRIRLNSNNTLWKGKDYTSNIAVTAIKKMELA